MSQLLINDIIPKQEEPDEDSNDEDLNNFKGVFYNDDDSEQRYYDYGAHFPYELLCFKLEEIVKNLPMERRGKYIYEDSNNNNFFGGINIFIKEQFNRNNNMEMNSAHLRSHVGNLVHNVSKNKNLIKNNGQEKIDSATNKTKNTLNENDKYFISIINNVNKGNLESNPIQQTMINKSRNINYYKINNNNGMITQNLINTKNNITKTKINTTTNKNIKIEEKKSNDIYTSFTNEINSNYNNLIIKAKNIATQTKLDTNILIKKSSPVPVIDKIERNKNVINKTK
jgi:hypothetical protein